MHFVNIAFFFLAAIGQSAAKVELRKGINQTVTFDGEEVEIQVNKQSRNIGFLVLCFGSTPDVSIEPCPKGYAAFSPGFDANTVKRIFKVDRQGRLTEDYHPQVVAGTIKFNEDGGLNILVKTMPDAGTIVILPNAEKWVPKPTVKVNEAKKKPTSNAAIYVVFVCCFLLLLIISGIVIYFYINRRKKDSMLLGQPQKGSLSNSDKSMENTRGLTSPVVVKSPMPIHASPQSPAKPISKPMALSPIKTSNIKTCPLKVSMTPVTQHATTQSTVTQTNSITHSQVAPSAASQIQSMNATNQIGPSTPPPQRMSSNRVISSDSNGQSDYSMKHPSYPH